MNRNYIYQTLGAYLKVEFRQHYRTTRYDMMRRYFNVR